MKPQWFIAVGVLVVFVGCDCGGGDEVRPMRMPVVGEEGDGEQTTDSAEAMRRLRERLFVKANDVMNGLRFAVQQ